MEGTAHRRAAGRAATTPPLLTRVRPNTPRPLRRRLPVPSRRWCSPFATLLALRSSAAAIRRAVGGRRRVHGRCIRGGLGGTAGHRHAPRRPGGGRRRWCLGEHRQDAQAGQQQGHGVLRECAGHGKARPRVGHPQAPECQAQCMFEVSFAVCSVMLVSCCARLH